MTVLFCLVFSATVDFCTVGSVLCRLYFVSSSSLRVRLLCEGSILWILCRSDCPWWRRYFRALRRVFLHPLQVHTMVYPCVVIKCAREQKKLLAGTLRCYLVWVFFFFSVFFLHLFLLLLVLLRIVLKVCCYKRWNADRNCVDAKLNRLVMYCLIIVACTLRTLIFFHVFVGLCAHVQTCYCKCLMFSTPRFVPCW